jgi:vitamin B12 transporter
VRRSIPVLLCLVGVLVGLPLAAQNPPGTSAQETTPVLNEVVVTATRIDTDVLDSPSAVTVITSRQVEESGATDVAQLIAGTPGAMVNDGGTVGAAQTISLRGSTSASQVLVLLDGVRLNSSRDGGVDLSTIPLELVDRIEIVRGGASALYGSGAIGGVINIITKKPTQSRFTFSLTNGSYIPHAGQSYSTSGAATAVDADMTDLVDSQTVLLDAAGVLGEVGINGGGSLTRAANGFTWFDATQTNDWRRRTNDGAVVGTGFLGMSAPLLGGQLSVKGDFSLSSLGTPGTLTSISTEGTQSETTAAGTILWKTDHLFSDTSTLDLKGFYRYDALAAADPAPPVLPAYNDLHQTQTIGLDATQKIGVSELLALVYGASGYYDYIQSTKLAGTRDRLNLAGFASVPWTPSEVLTITPSVRYDYFSDFSGSLSYSLSGVLATAADSSLHLSLSSAYRAPTLNDMYWGDAFMPGNPNLKPETSYGAEAGWRLETPRLGLDAAVFARYILDSIVWAPTPLPSDPWTPKNLGKAFEPGVELHARVLVIDQVSVDASYTFIYSWLLNDGTTDFSFADNRRVLFVPLHTGGVHVQWNGASHAVGLEALFTSDRFTDSANTPSSALPGYFVVNAGYRYTASDSLQFSLALKNVFNALYYTSSGYPMPPFSIQTGVKVKL